MVSRGPRENEPLIRNFLNKRQTNGALSSRRCIETNRNECKTATGKEVCCEFMAPVRNQLSEKNVRVLGEITCSCARISCSFALESLLQIKTVLPLHG